MMEDPNSFGERLESDPPLKEQTEQGPTGATHLAPRRAEACTPRWKGPVCQGVYLRGGSPVRPPKDADGN